MKENSFFKLSILFIFDIEDSPIIEFLQCFFGAHTKHIVTKHITTKLIITKLIKLQNLSNYKTYQTTKLIKIQNLSNY